MAYKVLLDVSELIELEYLRRDLKRRKEIAAKRAASRAENKRLEKERNDKERIEFESRKKIQKLERELRYYMFTERIKF